MSSVSGSMTATAANGTPVSRNGTGTVSDSDEDKEYDICVPYFAKGIEHRYEIKKGNKVVDSFAYVVPAADGAKETITTDKGIEIEITTDHKVGVNGSPSKGCFTYVPPRVKVGKKK